LRYRRLGHSGLRVSAICLGSWGTMGNPALNGGQATDRRWLKLLDEAAQRGINFIDTADVYQDGGAERLIGQWLRTVDRRQVVLATKVGGRTWNGSNGDGAGRKHLREACEASLRRLSTDYLDLYQLHSPDPGTPVEETISALDNLVNSGKILYWGLSNWSVPAAREVVEYARGANRSVPISLQNRLNLLRYAEAPRYSAMPGLGLLAYSPLAQGLLCDRQLNGAPFPGSRVASDTFLSGRLSALRDRLQVLSRLAGERRLTLSQLALAWLLQQPAVCSAVIGVSNRGQLAENVAAADITLSEDDLRVIGAAVTRTETQETHGPGDSPMVRR
jgi:aryl-alcohol dehydrogenase-like predicted oxidoreductase